MYVCMYVCMIVLCCVQAAAEERAAASAKEGLGRRLKEAEATAQALTETTEELRVTLDRQRASAELRYAVLPLPAGSGIWGCFSGFDGCWHRVLCLSGSGPHHHSCRPCLVSSTADCTDAWHW